MFSSELLPHGSKLGEEEWMFQQGETSIYTTIGVKNWFAANKGQVLPWPSKSFDLNIVENIWAMLARQLYVGGK